MKGGLPLLAGLAAALALALAACDPDLPGRACSSDDDCFRDEFCQGTSCVSGTRDPGAEGEPEDPDVDAGPAEGDAGADAETG